MKDKTPLSDPNDSNEHRHTSERKVKANRENSKKSTGPKTERGKRNSSANAMKHGLLSTRIPTEDVEELNDFATKLREHYEVESDVKNELLRDFALVDLWRLKRGLDAEKVPLGHLDACVPGHSQHVLQYNKTNRRALMRTIDELEKACRLVKRESEVIEQPTDDSVPGQILKGGKPSPNKPIVDSHVEMGEVDNQEHVNVDEKISFGHAEVIEKEVKLEEHEIEENVTEGNESEAGGTEQVGNEEESGFRWISSEGIFRERPAGACSLINPEGYLIASFDEDGNVTKSISL